MRPLCCIGVMVIRSAHCQNGIGQLIFSCCSVERIRFQLRHAMRNAHFLQHGESVEGVRANHGNTFQHVDLFQTLRNVGSVCLVSARTEDITKPSDIGILKGCTDKRHRDLRQLVTLRKRTDADDQIQHVVIGNCYLGKFVAHKGICTDVVKRLRHRKLAVQSCISKGVVVDPLHLAGFRQRQFGQGRASVECEIRNFRHSIGNGDLFEVSAAIERSLVDTTQLVPLGKGHLGQALTVCKGIIVNCHHAGGNLDLSQCRTVECTITQ